MAVFSFGSNLGSQLAQSSSFDDTCIPTRIPFFDDKEVMKVACGVMHTLVIIAHKVYSYGCDDEAALGREGPEHEVLEVKIKEKIVDVSCGTSHSVALGERGNVYGWGTFRDRSGVLGFKPGVRLQKKPVVIARKIEKIISCDNYVAMVNFNGSVECYGPELFKKDIRRKKSIVSLKKRTVMRKKKNMGKIEKLGAGSNHCFFISEGKVFGWGNNLCGQMGNGEKENFNDVRELEMSDMKDIDGGMIHSLFLKSNGDLLASGGNTHGNLGNNSLEAESLFPVHVLENVKYFSCAGSMNLAVVGNKLYSWGANFYGELGKEGEKHIKPGLVDFDFGEIVCIKAGCNHAVIVTK
ncbi:Regulator of chromosome condensation [Gurleya vavrai]